MTILGFVPGPEGFVPGHGVSLGIDLRRPDADPTVEAVKLFRTQALTAPPPRRDPLVLDLDGSGQPTTTTRAEGTHFDLDGNGMKEATGWLTGTDGLLARDLNGDGVINNGRELFGDATLLPTGQAAPNAFAALDENGDGYVDAQDSAFSELHVWQDANRDGVTDAGELQSLSDHGITRLGVTATDIQTTDTQGNVLGRFGQFVRDDGTTGQAREVLFDRDPAATLDGEKLLVPADIATLPDFTGAGVLRDLHQVLVREAEGGPVRSALNAYLGATSNAGRNLAVKDLIFAWAEVSSVGATSRGALMDARELGVVEKFLGQTLFDSSAGPTSTNQAAPLQQAWQAIYDNVQTALSLQTSLKPWFDDHVSIVRDENADKWSIDFGGLASVLSGDASEETANRIVEFARAIRVLGFREDPVYSEFKETVGTAQYGLRQLMDIADGTIAGRYRLGTAVAETITGDSGLDFLWGGNGNDSLGGGSTSDVGGIGYITGYYSPGAGNSYQGGRGNDTLRGTTLGDMYLFNLGDGVDTIIEPWLSGQPSSTDVIRFGAGINPSDIQVVLEGANLALRHANGLDAVIVNEWFEYYGYTKFQVERVEFADGTVWHAPDLTQQAVNVTGTNGDDVISGAAGHSNTLRGALGNDKLTGGNMSDKLYGDAGNDLLSGGGGNDVLDGGDGADTLDGGAGADLLIGGSGDDTLGGALNSADCGRYNYGYVSPGAGNTYSGGQGNDLLRGTSLADLYLFNLGDGADTISEVTINGQPSGQVDILRFGEQIAPSDINVKRDGANLVLAHINGIDRITVQNWFEQNGGTQLQVERAEFADGTVWTSTDLSAAALRVVGTDSNDVINGTPGWWNILNGGAGDDVLTGNNQADLLLGGDGNDTLNGGKGADVLKGGAGDDVLGGTQGVASSNTDSGYYAYGYVSPGAGNTYEGGLGNDLLRGTSLADLYLFNLGDGHDTIVECYVREQPGGQTDVLRFGSGIALGDITSVREGQDLVFAHCNNVDRVTVKDWFASSNYQLERVEFADGTVWTGAEATAMALTQHGTDGNDTLSALSSWANSLFGNGGNDTLNGGTGNDLLVGGEGGDALKGGTGNDAYRYLAGDGFDVITDTGGTDVLEMGGLDMSVVAYWRQGDDLSIELGDTGAGVLVTGQFVSSGANRVENFVLNGDTYSANDMQLMAQLRI